MSHEFNSNDLSVPSEEYWQQYFNDRFNNHVTMLKEKQRIEYELGCKNADDMSSLKDEDLKEARSLNSFNFPIIQRRKVKLTSLKVKLKQHLAALGIGFLAASWLFVYALAITKGWIK